MAYETRLGAGIRQLGDVDNYRMLRGKDLDITEADALPGPLADTDIFLVDDNAAGTQASTNKITAATLSSYINTNLPDSFLSNSGDDVTTGTITAAGFTTTGTWTFDEYTSGTVGITTIQDSGTTFNDNDTSLLTAGAIADYVADNAAANFVVEEHYRWDNDIQSTATINHLNLSSDTPGEAEVLVINDGDAVWGHPEKIHLQIRNDEGATIPAGAPLYSRGEIGGSNRIKVGICDADDSAKMPCIGLAEAEMNTSSTKDNFAITQGIYNTNISGFTGLAVGDTLYVDTSSSAPHLIKTKPTGESSLIQNVGIVLKTNGSTCQGLQVSAIGRTNDVPNLNSGYVFYGNGSNQAVSTQLSTLLPPNLTVDGAGTIHSNNVPTLNQNTTGNADTASVATTAANATNAQHIGVTANADNEEQPVPFLDRSTGDAVVHSDAGITYNPNNNALTTATFIGALTGDVTGDVSGSAGTVTSIGNLTGEVTSTNRSTTIADNVVDEANLKVSNAPTNGYALTAQSGTGGGLTWADVSSGGGSVSINGTPSADQMITWFDADTIQGESTLTYSSEVFTIGAADIGNAYIRRRRNSSGNGGRFYIQGADATGTNETGGGVNFEGGKGTGSGIGGGFYFWSHSGGSSGSTLGSLGEIASLNNSGDLQIDGDLKVSGNDIKDSGGNSIISSDGSGVVTMPGGNINIDGSNSNFNFNNGADIVLGADVAGGTSSTIMYLDSGSTNRYMLMAEATNKVVLCNRASNGTVEIRANNSTAGGGGESTIATFTDRDINFLPAAEIRGTNIGTVYDTAMYLTPHDFVMSSDSGSKNAYSRTSNGGDVAVNSSTVKIMASFQVPIGYKAVSVTVYGDSTSSTFEVFKCEIDDATNASVSSSTNINGTATLTASQNGYAGRYWSVVVRLGSSSRNLRGAKVILART